MSEEWRFLRGRRWITWFVLVVLFAIGCHFLAQWQLARRAEALAEINRLETNYNAPAQPVNEVLQSLDAFSIDQKWLPVALTGQYLSNEEVLVRNRPCNNASGYEVITPFQLDSGDVFFVDRGCVGSGTEVNTAAPFAPAPTGEVTISARLQAGEPLVSGREDTGDTIGSINLDTLATRVGLPSFTGAYGLLMGGDPNQAPYPADEPELDEGPHLSYALQWYVFAVGAFVVYGWAANQERRNLLSDAEDAAASEAAETVAETPATPAPTTDAALSDRYGTSGAGGRKRLALPKRQKRNKSAEELEDELIDQQG